MSRKKPQNKKSNIQNFIEEESNKVPTFREDTYNLLAQARVVEVKLNHLQEKIQDLPTSEKIKMLEMKIDQLTEKITTLANNTPGKSKSGLIEGLAIFSVTVGACIAITLALLQYFSPTGNISSQQNDSKPIITIPKTEQLQETKNNKKG